MPVFAQSPDLREAALRARSMVPVPLGLRPCPALNLQEEPRFLALPIQNVVT